MQRDVIGLGDHLKPGLEFHTKVRGLLYIGHRIVSDNTAVKAMQLTGYLLPDSAKTEQPNDLVIQ